MRLIYTLSSKSKTVFDDAVCNRTIMALGRAAQEIFSGLSVGVTGGGGLACIVLELLTRLWVGMITVCDFDLVEDSNLNRLLGAHFYDGRLRTPKVLVAARNALLANPNVRMEIIQGDFLEKKNQERFKSMDLVFGCSDSDGVRLAANQLCIACGIPYFDLGCGAVVENGILKSAGGQVIKVIPGRGFCLQCGGFFDHEAARVEFLDPEEAKRQRAMGYVKGEHVPQPQVYALNMMVASWAVWMMMRYVVGENLGFDGVYVDALSFESRTWVEEKQKDCPICGEDGVMFRGDEVPLLTRESFDSGQLPKNLRKPSAEKPEDGESES